MKTEELAKTEWVSIWSGKFNFLACSHFGEQYTKTLLAEGKKFSTRAVFVIHKRISTAFLPIDEKEAFGKHLAASISKDPSRKIKELCNNFKKEVDKTLRFIKEKEDKEISLDIYKNLWKHIDDYYIPHITCKYIVDYLSKDLLDKYIGDLQKARLYAEPVFTIIEEFIEKIAKSIAKKSEYKTENLLCMVKEEMFGYLKNGKLPKEEVLRNRYENSALIFENGNYKLFTGNDAVKIEKIVTNLSKTNEIIGQTAYPGKAQGIVRIVFIPSKIKKFNDGDILVTGMTRPEFLPLIKKSAAFVTDAGGILSHAAIEARELKKPCIIGTKIATKVFKDGDLVEVDADKGTVRKIK